MTVGVHENRNVSGMQAGMWAKAPSHIWSDPGLAHTFREDFITDPAAPKWTVDESDTYGDVALLANFVGGAANLYITSNAGSDNAEAWISSTSEGFVIDGGNGELFFMARIRTSTITDNALAFFVGLAQPQAAGDDKFHVDDTGALADIDAVGFLRKHDDGDAIDTVVSTGGGALVEVAAGAIVPAVDTWYNLGIYFDGTRVYFYNGTTQLADSILESATNFPDGLGLAPAIAIKAGTASAAYTFHADWINCAQLKV